MSDNADKCQAWQEQLLALQLAPRLEVQFSEEEKAQIALSGRECGECGLPIPPARLRANPYAFRCIDCQTEAEEYGR